MSSIGTTLAGTPPFPAQSVADALRDELIKSVRAIGQTQGIALPVDDPTLVGSNFDLDSLVAVEALCVLDAVLPFQVTETVVNAGGYPSIATAIDRITQRCEGEWQKHYSKVSAK